MKGTEAVIQSVKLAISSTALINGQALIPSTSPGWQVPQNAIHAALETNPPGKTTSLSFVVGLDNPQL